MTRRYFSSRQAIFTTILEDTFLKVGDTVHDRQLRQEHLLQVLRENAEPIRGEALAQVLGVTRQVVVHEIALMRAQGSPIVSTPRGYYLDRRTTSQNRTVLAVRHSTEMTANELYILIDHGLTVHDVIVEHPLYGELKGSLQLRSRMDVAHFLEQISHGHIALLSSLTEGYHLHTVTYPSESRLYEAIRALEKHAIPVLN